MGAPFAEALFGSLFELLFGLFVTGVLLDALLEAFALIFQGLVCIRSCLHPAWPGGAIGTLGGDTVARGTPGRASVALSQVGNLGFRLLLKSMILYLEIAPNCRRSVGGIPRKLCLALRSTPFF